MRHLTRRLIALAALATLVACTSTTERGGYRNAGGIGEFKLGHSIIVTKNMQKVQPTKDVTGEEWETALRTALERRFRPYEGDQLYHLAINVLGYSVAVPGVPLVVSPKSLVVVEATVWDNSKSLGADPTEGKLNKEPRKFWVYESFSPETVVGAGLVKSEAEQVANLSANIAFQIEEWMRENPQWFEAQE